MVIHLPGTDPLSTFFRGKSKCPESLGSWLFSAQNNLQAKETFGGCKFCSPTEWRPSWPANFITLDASINRLPASAPAPISLLWVHPVSTPRELSLVPFSATGQGHPDLVYGLLLFPPVVPRLGFLNITSPQGLCSCLWMDFDLQVQYSVHQAHSPGPCIPWNSTIISGILVR